MAETTAARRRRWPDGYDPEATRTSIMDSALALFQAQGFDGTSIREIVDRADLTKGAFYHHFATKEELLWEIQNSYIEAQLAAITEIMAASEDPRVRLRELIRVSLTSIADFHPHVTIFYQERRHLAGPRFTEVAAKRDEVERAFNGVIRDGVERGFFRSDLDPRITTFGLVGMCAWAYQWYKPDGAFAADEIARQFGAMILEGILVPEAR
ncbi:TetR/AcrR family transcriptional regulator [Actinocorallia sp. A-T 12471]|uniref:TetR/AcrR family transcriptional regulator n=1 Tax=Actinocorallia sp. A-T 12471 TaxID=3089813 RepID=UPI0029D291A8|nr:TetR/AcrR family transcriptional regulator [Actinocorallia sp. A-T 12471]MDX6739455.1 TetR/AcrR family transcriptional regulator [Actinocorallia sp. A-T 12471]